MVTRHSFCKDVILSTHLQGLSLSALSFYYPRGEKKTAGVSLSVPGILHLSWKKPTLWITVLTL